MQFKLFALAAAAFATISSAQSVSVANQLIVNISAVTDASAETARLAQSLAPINVFTTVPQIVNNFRVILTSVQNTIFAIGENPKSVVYTDDEQLRVCETFRSFVRVHQDLLNAVIGKYSLLSLTPFTAPIAAILRALESVVDSFAFSVIDLVPTCSAGALSEKSRLDATFALGIATYSS